jgi:hypothetical protein
MKSILITNIYCILTVLLLLGCNKNKCSDSERQRWIVQSPMKIAPQSTEIYLGDTLVLTIEIPYSNVDQQRNMPVDITGCQISEFGLDIRLLNRTIDDKLLIDGVDKFKIEVTKGASRPFTVTSIQNVFQGESNQFTYKAKIVPLKKGLVHIINLRAEGQLNNQCAFVDFSPVCNNNTNNYDLYYQFISFLGSSEYFNLPGRYYVWVK